MQNHFALKRLLFLKSIGYKFINQSEQNLAQNVLFQNLNELKNQINSCSLCYLKNGSNDTFIGQGKMGAKILVVTFLQSEITSQFQNLKTALSSSDDNIYASCIVRCKSDKNTPPECVQMCKPYLLCEINLLKPKLIVTLGAKALFALMPELQNSDINAIRGSLLKFANTNLLPTFSPSWLAKNPSFIEQFQDDLAKIRQICN